jgi:uncharacterized protein (DUF433 family)
MEKFHRIAHNPAVMGGKPCIRGMRATVGMIVGMMGAGHSKEHLLERYPCLEPEDIDQALACAVLLRLPDELAVREARLVVTMDKDFGELVFRDTRGPAGVALLRLHEADGAQRPEAVAEILTQHLDRLPGRFGVFKKARLRTRA